MYPDWPKSDADLVPLPRCIGPKLKPFNFHGPQQIEFLELLGEGSHAHVFKVKILGKIYALKLFRFLSDFSWLGVGDLVDVYDREAMGAFFNFSQPFNRECRAYGRLQEAGCEDLALKCHGYVLLDEAHERAVVSQFSAVLPPIGAFCGEVDGGDPEARTWFLCEYERPPPIRGIVKEFGVCDEENLRPMLARKILSDVIKFNQLGIVQVDPATRQIFNGKLCDFSQALTTSHYIMTPELNPNLGPGIISAMEMDTFFLTMQDYMSFATELEEWNGEYGDKNGRIAIDPCPGGDDPMVRYELRSNRAKDHICIRAEPRKYDWRTCPVRAESSREGVRRRTRSERVTRGGKARHRSGLGTVSRIRRQLSAGPPLWYYRCGTKIAANGEWRRGSISRLPWEYKDGLLFPNMDKRHRFWVWALQDR